MNGSDLNGLAVVTAADKGYFRLLWGLLTSIRMTHSQPLRLVVLDIGLTPRQIAFLEQFGCEVVPAEWDLGPCPWLQPHWRALMAKAFLPRYVKGASHILFIDADIWVQRPNYFHEVLKRHKPGCVTITQEKHVADINVGQFHRCGSDYIPFHHERMKVFYGREASALPRELPYNTGMFMLETNSPIWDTWQKDFARVLPKTMDGAFRAAEQTSLTYLIFTKKVKASKLPFEFNYLLNMGLPVFDETAKEFLNPVTRKPIFAVHLVEFRGVSKFPLTTAAGRPMTLGSFDYFGVMEIVS
jgi:lipopolysaccharide biosynthesis glycosyltransferase